MSDPSSSELARVVLEKNFFLSRNQVGPHATSRRHLHEYQLVASPCRTGAGYLHCHSCGNFLLLLRLLLLLFLLLAPALAPAPALALAPAVALAPALAPAAAFAVARELPPIHNRP